MRVPVLVMGVVLLSFELKAASQDGISQELARELAALKSELEAIQARYEARFREIEARLEALAAGRAVPSTEPAAPEESELLAEAAQVLSGVGSTQQVPGPTAIGGSTQTLNPNISVIGDFVAAANRNVPDFEGGPVDLREVEVGFQAQIDPFARADFFVAVPSLEEVEIEEGYVTFLTLPSNFLARVGKLRVPFGRANVNHRPETFTVDRPDVITNYFGEEGLAETGFGVARLLPNPWDVFMEVELDVLQGDNEVSFGGGTSRDLLYNVHYRSFFELSSEQSLNVGASYATGVNTTFDEGEGRARTHLEGVDLTYQWKPLARGKYRSFLWQTEFMLGQRDTDRGRVDTWGMYSFARYQLGRRWYLGGRFDYAQSPFDSDESLRSLSTLAEFYPSEFQRFRVQYKFTDRRDAFSSHQIFFQWFYLIGTHGAHKF